MKLVEAQKDKLLIELSGDEAFLIGGLFAMISALRSPDWETSTGQEDSAITSEQFDRAYRAWAKLLDGPAARPFFEGA